MPTSAPTAVPVRTPIGILVWWRTTMRNNKLLVLTTGPILVSALLALLLLLVERERTLEAGEHTTQVFAAVVDEQVSRTIQTVDQRLQLVAMTLTDMQASGEPDPRAVRAMLRQQITSLPFVRSIWTLDARGRVRYSWAEGQVASDLSDRDYFTIYLTRPGSGFFLGEPVRSRTANTWLVSAARPLADRDGNFAGVVVVAIEPQYFDRLWQSMALDKSGSVALLRTDGKVLLRSPWSDAAIAGDDAGKTLITQYLPAGASGAFRSERMSDGTHHSFAYRTLAERPDLVVVVSRSLRAILAPWRSLVWLVLVLWAAVSLLATTLAIAFQRLSAQRSLAEQHSAQAAHRLTLAADAANIVVWDWDPRTDRYWATPTHYTSLGYPAPDEQVDMRQWRALIHEDDRARVDALVDSVHGDPHLPYNYEVRMRHADGGYRWCHVIGRTIEHGSDGNPTRLIGVRMDVTERRKADLEREQIFSRITDGFVALDLQWRFVYANKQAGELLGHAPDSLIGRDLWTVFPPRPDETFHIVCRQAMQDQQPTRLEAYSPRFGRWIEDHIYPSPQGLSIYFRDITQRKLDEEALRDAKEYAENLIAGANAMIVGLNTDGNVTLFNAVAQRLTGYTLADFQGRNWFDLLVPRQRYPQVWEAFERLHDGRLPGFFENPILTRSGEERLIAWQSSVLYQGGVISGSLSFGIDVTEQRRAETALQQSEQRYRLLVDSSPYAIGVHQDGRLVMVNQAALNLVGASDAQQLLGTSILDRVHPDHRVAAQKRISRMMAGEPGLYPTQDRYLRLDGSAVDVQVTAAPFMFQGQPAIQVIALDITRQKLAEQSLLQSEARFRGAFNSSGIGMSITALDGHWLRVNPALCDIVGYSTDEMRQTTFMSLTHPADLTADLAHMDDLLAGRFSSFQMEKRYLHKQGHSVWVNLTVALVRDSDGRPLHTVAQMEDISQRKQLEADLRASQADLATTLDALPDLLFEVDIEGRYLAYHSPRTDLLMLPPRQLIGLLVSDVLPPAAATSILEGLQETFVTGRSSGRQIDLALPNGRHWFELTMARKPEVPGQPPCFVVLSRDITDRKSLQLQDEVEREVLQFMTSDRTLPEVLEHFVLGYASLLPGARGSVLLLDEDGIHIRHGAAPQLPAAFCDAIDGLPIGPREGSCGTAAFFGESIVVADIDSNPLWQDYRELARSHGLRACWSMPIKSTQGAVLGTFAFYFDAPREASVAERALLERGAHLASTAIERHRAVEQLQQGEERYRSLVHWTPLGIGVHQNGKIVFANPGCMAILGAVSEADLLGRPILDFFQPPDHAEVNARIAGVLAGENMAMVLRKYVKIDGSLIDVEGKGALITFNGRPAVQFSMRDVTAEKAAQAALLSSRQQLRVLSARVLAAQETERRRVAHELHDELGQALTALKINLQAQGRSGVIPPTDLLAENVRIVEHMLQHVRGLALALRPSMLDDLGLVPALRWLTEQHSARNALGVVFRAPAHLQRLSPDLETAVFRIVQEALTNVLRHAKASDVEVTLQVEDDTLRVKIRDDGVGFDVAAMQRRAAEGASIGVLGMVERASLVGATLTIDAHPGRGTTVTLVCPIGTAAT